MASRIPSYTKMTTRRAKRGSPHPTNRKMNVGRNKSARKGRR